MCNEKTSFSTGDYKHWTWDLRSKDPRTQGPEGPGTRGPRDPRAQGPEDPGTRGPRDPRTQGPRDPGTQGSQMI